MGDDDFWCERCQNSGTVDCHCGGDICICQNNGEKPCPKCGGEPTWTHDDDYDDRNIITGEREP